MCCQDIVEDVIGAKTREGGGEREVKCGVSNPLSTVGVASLSGHRGVLCRATDSTVMSRRS